MKQTLIALLFFVLSISLFGQTGLFDISFGASFGETREILEKWDPPFKFVSATATVAEFSAPGNEAMDKLVVYLSDNTVTGWDIYFYDLDDDIYDAVLSSLEERHGDDNDWDDEYEIYTWYLDNGNMVTLSYTYEHIIVEYY